jgi:hypothetical protein
MKPSEAIANIEYARKWLGTESDFSDEALDIAIEVLEKQETDRWHSVTKEGNPKESNNYLVTLEKGKVMEDFYHVPDNEWSTASRIGCGTVAWKPLPEPYTEDEA